MSLTKKNNPKPKFFFHCKLIDLSNLRGFEQLSSTISWGAMWLVSQPKYPCFSPSFELCHRQSSTLNKHNKQSQHIWETVVNTVTCSPKTEPKVMKNLKNFINSNPNPFKKKWLHPNLLKYWNRAWFKSKYMFICGHFHLHLWYWLTHKCAMNSNAQDADWCISVSFNRGCWVRIDVYKCHRGNFLHTSLFATKFSTNVLHT